MTTTAQQGELEFVLCSNILMSVWYSKKNSSLIVMTADISTDWLVDDVQAIPTARVPLVKMILTKK